VFAKYLDPAMRDDLHWNVGTLFWMNWRIPLGISSMLDSRQI